MKANPIIEGQTDEGLSSFVALARRVFDEDPELNRLPLEDILMSIPSVADIGHLPKGTTVLVRADLDVPVKDGKVVDPTRIETCAGTVEYCHKKGWKTVLLGHIGRDKEVSLLPVAEAASREIGIPIRFVPDWIEASERSLSTGFVEEVRAAPDGCVFMAQNARKYQIERALWNATDASFLPIAQQMYELASDVSRRLSNVEINEAIAASNIDFSSSVLPLNMTYTALGAYSRNEFISHITRARLANCVIFSGLKADKLDELEGLLDRGKVSLILVAGSLAMALLKARALLDGRDFHIGLAETDPRQKAYVPPERIDQAKRIVMACASHGVDLVLPVDFILDDGSCVETIPPGHAQLDVGKKTQDLFANVIQGFIESDKMPKILFYNGVFGKFEDPRFEQGTKAFIPLLKEATTRGVETYVGGGEGRLALVKYGSVSDVTHAFTCGGTVLKSMTNNHIGFLKAMYLQNTNSKRD